MAQQSTFLEELMAAGRGVFGLLIGDKKAGGYFDFSRRGLYGSFIALVLVLALGAFLPLILSSEHDSAATSMVQLVVLYVGQVGFATIVLRQIKRMDALVPYLVGYNWLSFFVTLILAALNAAGIDGSYVIIVIGIAAIVLEVNVARILMTLSPLQIAMLLIAEIVGVALAALLLTLIFPASPDLAGQLAAASAAAAQ